MSARVLVAAGLNATARSLAARLTADYFDVLTARSGEDAFDICLRERIDVALLDLPGPGLSGVELCRVLKSDPATLGMAVALVSPREQPGERAEGFAAGADDLLDKPVDPLALVTRVRNLSRLRMLNDELAQRTAAFQRMGLRIPAPDACASNAPARVLLIEDDRAAVERAFELLGAEHTVLYARDSDVALEATRHGGADTVLISLELARVDALRLCSQIRSCEHTRD
ncbi:MAG TPA: response regulator, partial [Hyphomicrobiaceae bacterium]|nr:response regulator [Hyphomicrobiaceae bacterium]